MNVVELGTKMVQMVNAGRESEEEFVREHYSPNAISIEAGENGADSIEGLDAIFGKHEWWYNNHEVHGSEASGPYVGHRQDQFVIRFNMDLTPIDGEREQMEEVGLFTVQDGKIVQEEFLYRMG